MDIRGRIALVTGASSGIGEATALELARRGARVALLARSREGLERVANQIHGRGGAAEVFSVDLTDYAAVAKAAQSVIKRLGTPDLIVNNAGLGRWLFVDETEPAEAQAMMASPYFAAFHVTRAFLPAMLARGSGHIVNISSPAAYFPIRGAAAYSAARWAMRGFSEALRADLYGTGLKVSLIVPGHVRTPYFERNPGSEDRIPGVSGLIPVLSPEQVARAIADAIERERREVILPRALGLVVLLHRFLPGPFDWLFLRTGARR